MSDADHRAWLRGQARRAAARFGVTLDTSASRWGWRLRSLSGPAHRGRETLWLRLGTELERDLPGAYWDGIPASTALAEQVPMPRVLNSAEWPADGDRAPRRVRADLMTRLPGQPCSPGEMLRDELHAPDTWWADLRTALDTLAAAPGRDTGATYAPSRMMRAVLGDQAAEQHQVEQWETAHGDLHWAQLLQPDLGVLDWEMWGTRPAGTDPATLYIHAAPRAPHTAARVRELFAHRLDTDAGHTALVRAAARAVHRAPAEWPDLEGTLRALLGELLR